MSAFAWGLQVAGGQRNSFPMNPSGFIVPASKTTDHSYSIDGTMIVSSPLYNENEFSIEWDRVTRTNDSDTTGGNMNDIVDFVIGLAAEAEESNRNQVDELNGGSVNMYREFYDGTGTISGLAMITGLEVSVKREGRGAQLYTLRLNFKLY